MKKLFAILLIMLITLTGLFAGGSADNSLAEETDWTPDGPITIVLGFSAGGGIDVMCRTVAPFLGEYLGCDVIVQNMPGSSSGIATDYVLDQAPDGQTILGTSSSMSAFSTTENSDASYLQLDMLAMPYLCRNVGVVVNTELGIDTMEEFIDYLKTHRTTAATAGVGSMWHIPAAELASQLGCEDNVRFVPYDSGSRTALAVAQHECDWAAIDYANAGSYFEQGLCKMLAVFSTEDMNDAHLGIVPSIVKYAPEMADTADIIGGWRGFCVSNETPQYIKDKLIEAFKYACSQEEVQNLVRANGNNVEDMSYGEEAQAYFEQSCRVSSYLLWDLGDGTRDPSEVGVERP